MAANIPPGLSRSSSSTSFITPQATTYRRILDHLNPRELLGLTATPERGDGLDVRAFFDGGSRPSSDCGTPSRPTC